MNYLCRAIGSETPISNYIFGFIVMDIVPIGMSHTRESVSTDGHNKVAEDRVPIATLLFLNVPPTS